MSIALAPPWPNGADEARGLAAPSETAERPKWSRPALFAVAITAAVAYFANLSANGLGNSFYAAAVKSGTVSWKAFFFGSLDPGSFITVDKPPLTFWVQAIVARIFGFSSWSLLVPEALAGVGAVLVLYYVVRRWAGDVAAILAAAGLALTPIAAVMFRFNDPDGIMTFIVVLAAWALWRALERGTSGWLIACGVLLGVAFLAKMLEAWLAVPAFALTYLLFGPPGLGRRVLQLTLGGVAMVISAGWWVAIVQLWPASSRPYIGSSSATAVGSADRAAALVPRQVVGQVVGTASPAQTVRSSSTWRRTGTAPST